jgi:type I site-specific restriction endonuclease
MVGRGCRLFPDKEFCRIIDFDHMTDKDLIGPGSLAELGSSEEAEFAKAIEDDQDIDLMEAVEQAKEKVKQNAEAVRVRVRAMELSYRRVEVTPFDAVTAFGVRPDYGSAYGEKATEAQSRVLERMGVTGADTTSKTQASRLISAAIERRSQGLCTLKQISMLIGLGVDRAKARKMSFEDASRTITERLQNA